MIYFDVLLMQRLNIFHFEEDEKHSKLPYYHIQNEIKG